MATNLEIIQDAISTDTIAQLTPRQQDLYRQGVSRGDLKPSPTQQEAIDRIPIPTPKFDQMGTGYDYETAAKYGIQPSAIDGHWQSIVPETGQVLKGVNHPTFDKTVEAERKMGNNIMYDETGRLFSMDRAGLRDDGTEKGVGHLGRRKMTDGSGRVVTDMTVKGGFLVDGISMKYPLLVPTLNEAEVETLMRGGKIPDSIRNKAIKHAKERMEEGLSPFSAHDETAQKFSPFYAYQELSNDKPKTGGYLSALFRGLGEGITTEFPAMGGRALQMIGLKKVGKAIVDWADDMSDELWGTRPEYEGFAYWLYQAGTMIPSSVIPMTLSMQGAKILMKMGRLKKALDISTKVLGKRKALAAAVTTAGKIGSKQHYTRGLLLGKIATRHARDLKNFNKASKAVNWKTGTSVGTFFGLSQAQSTKDTMWERIKMLEEQGDIDGANALRSKLWWAPIATGMVEGIGETIGARYLSKIFRIRAGLITQRTTGKFVQDFLLGIGKTMGAEIATEVGQAGGQAAIEKYSGVRPEARIMAEMVDVIGPTAVMTLLLGGASGAINIPGAARQIRSNNLTALHNTDMANHIVNIDRYKGHEKDMSGIVGGLKVAKRGTASASAVGNVISNASALIKTSETEDVGSYRDRLKHTDGSATDTPTNIETGLNDVKEAINALKGETVTKEQKAQIDDALNNVSTVIDKFDMDTESQLLKEFKETMTGKGGVVGTVKEVLGKGKEALKTLRKKKEVQPLDITTDKVKIEAAQKTVDSLETFELEGETLTHDGFVKRGIEGLKSDDKAMLKGSLTMLGIQLDRINNTAKLLKEGGMSVSSDQQNRIDKMRSDIEGVIQQHEEKIKKVSEEKKVSGEEKKVSGEKKVDKEKTKKKIKPATLIPYGLPHIKSLSMKAEVKDGVKYPSKEAVAKLYAEKANDYVAKQIGHEALTQKSKGIVITGKETEDMLNAKIYASSLIIATKFDQAKRLLGEAFENIPLKETDAFNNKQIRLIINTLKPGAKGSKLLATNNDGSLHYSVMNKNIWDKAKRPEAVVTTEALKKNVEELIITKDMKEGAVNYLKAIDTVKNKVKVKGKIIDLRTILVTLEKWNQIDNWENFMASYNSYKSGEQNYKKGTKPARLSSQNISDIVNTFRTAIGKPYMSIVQDIPSGGGGGGSELDKSKLPMFSSPLVDSLNLYIKDSRVTESTKNDRRNYIYHFHNYMEQHPDAEAGIGEDRVFTTMKDENIRTDAEQVAVERYIRGYSDSLIPKIDGSGKRGTTDIAGRMTPIRQITKFLGLNDAVVRKMYGSAGINSNAGQEADRMAPVEVTKMMIHNLDSEVTEATKNLQENTKSDGDKSKKRQKAFLKLINMLRDRFYVDLGISTMARPLEMDHFEDIAFSKTIDGDKIRILSGKFKPRSIYGAFGTIEKAHMAAYRGALSEYFKLWPDSLKKARDKGLVIGSDNLPAITLLAFDKNGDIQLTVDKRKVARAKRLVDPKSKSEMAEDIQERKFQSHTGKHVWNDILYGHLFRAFKEVYGVGDNPLSDTQILQMYYGFGDDVSIGKDNKITGTKIKGKGIMLNTFRHTGITKAMFYAEKNKVSLTTVADNAGHQNAAPLENYRQTYQQWYEVHPKIERQMKLAGLLSNFKDQAEILHPKEHLDVQIIVESDKLYDENGDVYAIAHNKTPDNYLYKKNKEWFMIAVDTGKSSLSLKSLVDMMKKANKYEGSEAMIWNEIAKTLDRKGTVRPTISLTPPANTDTPLTPEQTDLQDAYWGVEGHITSLVNSLDKKDKWKKKRKAKTDQQKAEIAVDKAKISLIITKIVNEVKDITPKQTEKQTKAIEKIARESKYDIDDAELRKSLTELFETIGAHMDSIGQSKPPQLPDKKSINKKESKFSLYRQWTKDITSENEIRRLGLEPVTVPGNISKYTESDLGYSRSQYNAYMKEKRAFTKETFEKYRPRLQKLATDLGTRITFINFVDAPISLRQYIKEVNPGISDYEVNAKMREIMEDQGLEKGMIDETIKEKYDLTIEGKYEVLDSGQAVVTLGHGATIKTAFEEIFHAALQQGLEVKGITDDMTLGVAASEEYTAKILADWMYSQMHVGKSSYKRMMDKVTKKATGRALERKNMIKVLFSLEDLNKYKGIIPEVDPSLTDVDKKKVKPIKEIEKELGTIILEAGHDELSEKAKELKREYKELWEMFEKNQMKNSTLASRLGKKWRPLQIFLEFWQTLTSLSDYDYVVMARMERNGQISQANRMVRRVISQINKFDKKYSKEIKNWPEIKKDIMNYLRTKKGTIFETQAIKDVDTNIQAEILWRNRLETPYKELGEIREGIRVDERRLERETDPSEILGIKDKIIKAKEAESEKIQEIKKLAGESIAGIGITVNPESKNADGVGVESFKSIKKKHYEQKMKRLENYRRKADQEALKQSGPDQWPDEVKRFAFKVKVFQADLGKMLLNRDIISDETYWAMHGMYIHYMYKKNILKEGLAKTTEQHVPESGLKQGWLEQRKDLDENLMNAHGFIEDWAAPLGKTMASSLETLAHHDYYEALKKSKDTVLDFKGHKGIRKADKGWVATQKIPDKYNEKWEKNIYEPDSWISKSYQRRSDALVDKNEKEKADVITTITTPKFKKQEWILEDLNTEITVMRDLITAEKKKGVDTTEMEVFLESLEDAYAPVANALGDKNLSDYKLFPANYGKLSGEYVAKPIWHDVNPILMQRELDSGISYGMALRGVTQSIVLFKIGKATLNVPTAFRNVISNVLQNNLRGRPLAVIPDDFRKAAQGMARINPDTNERGFDIVPALKEDGTLEKIDVFEEFLQHGGEWGTQVSEEIVAILSELDNFYKGRMGKGWFQFLNTLGKLSKYYGLIDVLAKYSIYRQLRTSGTLNKWGGGSMKYIDPRMAMKESQKWGMDYSLTSRSIKQFRKFLVPFITYQYKATSLIAESIIKRPWVMGKWALLMGVGAGSWSLAREAAQFFIGMDDDEWERTVKNLAHFIKNEKTFMPLPFRNAQGEVMFFDGSYFMPWGTWYNAVSDLSEGELTMAYQKLGVGNPFLTSYTALSSVVKGQPAIDPFTHKPLWNITDSTPRKWHKIISYMHNIVTPGMFENFTLPGADKYGAIPLSARVLASKIKGKEAKDTWGRVKGWEQFGRYFGVNTVTGSRRQVVTIKQARIKRIRASAYKELRSPSYRGKPAKKRAVLKRMKYKIKEIIAE